MLRGLLSLIFMTGNNEPVRLQKQVSKKEIINEWIEKNFYLIALASIIFLLACFILACYWSVGVSATESGTLYNHLQGVV